MAVAQEPAGHLLYWLEAAQRRVVDEVLMRGGVPVEVGMRRLRLLAMIPEGGARQQELADRALVSKQAVAELIATLEADGLVRRSPDPADRRAWRVQRTSSGQRALARLDHAIDGVEAALADQVGAPDYRRFAEVLRRIATSI